MSLYGAVDREELKAALVSASPVSIPEERRCRLTVFVYSVPGARLNVFVLCTYPVRVTRGGGAG